MRGVEAPTATYAKKRKSCHLSSPREAERCGSYFVIRVVSSKCLLFQQITLRQQQSQLRQQQSQQQQQRCQQ